MKKTSGIILLVIAGLNLLSIIMRSAKSESMGSPLYALLLMVLVFAGFALLQASAENNQDKPKKEKEGSKLDWIKVVHKIQEFSRSFDELDFLINQHWVVIDKINASKIVYIFQPNGVLLISRNGKVEKAKWDCLGTSSLLVDIQSESLLYRLGFMDANILALKMDGNNEYELFVNESKNETQLSLAESIIDYLNTNYLCKLENNLEEEMVTSKELALKQNQVLLKTRKAKTNKGVLEISTLCDRGFTKGDSVMLDGKPAPDGDYSTGWPAWLDYMTIKNGKIKSL
jgi:hypothetical protein